MADPIATPTRARSPALAAAVSAVLSMAGTASAQEPVGLGEVIVTATKRAERLQDVPESISARAGYAASATSGALAKPTGTQKQEYADAGKLLAAEVATLRKILDTDLPSLEKKLEELGAPLLPGRLPKLLKE